MGDFVNVYGDEIELTKEQRACTDYLGDKTLFVKGAAGAEACGNAVYGIFE